ncbi:MAG: PAS domain S-box protein [Gemmatimonadetes bacterium]|nr:PAS domain S-box protein [Gemmatimonadota bacterium]
MTGPGVPNPSEGLYRALVASLSNTFVAVVGRDHRFLSVDGPDVAAPGLAVERMIGRTVFEIFPPDYAAFLAERCARALSGEPVSFETTYGGRDFRARIAPLRGERGEITGGLVTAVDVTVQNRAEREMHALVDHAVFGVYRSGLDGEILMANRTLATMLGYGSPEELLGVDMTRDIYQEPVERAQLIAAGSANTGKPERADVAWKRKDGSAIIVRLAVRALRDDRGELLGFEGFVEDVTERRALEHQLRQAQKMEAVGQLAGGMAHDVNNLLTTVLTSTELVRGALPPDTPGQEDLDTIAQATERGAELIRKLLAFSRRQRLELGPVNIADLVNDFHPILRRVVRADIEFRLQLGDQGVVARADAGAVEQILVNLVTNARDAMPDGGMLTIAVQSAALDRVRCDRLGWGEPGRYVALTVRDTGTGMDDETRQRIFEPFFTTKPVGTGTGLGMSMVYGLVKQHLGYVSVESEPGHGTVITLYIPPTDEVPAAPPQAPATPATGGHETILVVDDEDSLRRATRRVLERQGYSVLSAGDGAEALELWRAHRGDIALVMSDVVMPRLTGPELWQVIEREHPGAKILFTSGYTDPGSQETASLPPGLPFLAKPWTINDLLRRVREVLDRPDAR